jgi:hypothetical protein
MGNLMSVQEQPIVPVSGLSKACLYAIVAQTTTFVVAFHFSVQFVDEEMPRLTARSPSRRVTYGRCAPSAREAIARPRLFRNES